MKLTPQFPPSDNSNLRVGANSLILEVISSNEYFPFFLCKQLIIFAYVAYGCVVYVRLTHFQTSFFQNTEYITFSQAGVARLSPIIHKYAYFARLQCWRKWAELKRFENDSLVAGNVLSA